MRLIFVSHASADRTLAESLARRIEASGPRIKTFLASRPGDIRADADWLHSVQKALRDADTYVILLTVNSVLRPWVSFETGAAWFSNKTCILVRAGGLTPEEIPLPLSAKQVYNLDAVDDATAVFRALGLEPIDISEFVEEAVLLGRQMQLAGEAELAWEGLEFQGTFYAWAGPLLELQDKAEMPYSPQLLELLKQRGLGVSIGDPERLSHHFGRGRCQVFATDRKSWRRPVVKGRQLLLVTRPEDMKR